MRDFISARSKEGKKLEHQKPGEVHNKNSERFMDRLKKLSMLSVRKNFIFTLRLQVSNNQKVVCFDSQSNILNNAHIDGMIQNQIILI